MISVIIPVLNEDYRIPALVTGLNFYGVEREAATFIDGGSTDRTQEILGKVGMRFAVQTGGLAAQLNRGIALNPEADIYWFLPVDITPAWKAREHIEKALADPSVVAGGFRLRFRSDRFVYRVIEWGARLRSPRGRLVLGDQGLFVRGEAMRRMAGFNERSLIPYWELCRRLLHLGRVITLPEVALASPREYEKHGVWRTWWKHQLTTLRFLRE